MCKDLHKLNLDDYECYVFDCDGVLWHGDEAIPGAVELIEELHKREKKVYFVTNASKRSRVELLKKIHNLGFKSVVAEQCYPSGFFCAEYLRSTYPAEVSNLYVIGGAGLVHELKLQGFNVTGGPDSNEFAIDVDESVFTSLASSLNETEYHGVVVGFDSNFNFQKLCKASIILQQNPAAFLCATNEDAFVRVGSFGMPGNGAIASTVKYCLATACRSVEDSRYLVTGKPDARIIDFVMAKAGVSDKRKCLMVGDRLDTDIQLAVNAGIHSCFVLSGCSTVKDLAAWGNSPTYVLDSVKAFL